MNNWCILLVYSFDDASSISSGDISDAINGLGADDSLTFSSASGGHQQQVDGTPASAGGGETAGGGILSRSLPSRSSGLLAPGSLASRSRQQQQQQTSSSSSGPSQGGGEATSINWHNYTISGDPDQQQNGSDVMMDVMTSSLGGSSAKQKRDSGTNTDHSVLRQQGGAGAGASQQGGPRQQPQQQRGGPAAANGKPGGIGGVPRAYVGIRMGEMSTSKGERISNYRGASNPLASLQQQQHGFVDGQAVEVAGGGGAMGMMDRRASGPSDLYYGNNVPLSSSTPRKISMPQQGDGQGVMQGYGGGVRGQYAPYVNANVPASMTELMMHQAAGGRPPSAMSNSSGSNSNANNANTNSWTRSAAQFANAMRSALSETESVESLPHQQQQQQQYQPPLSVHQQIQQARALSASGRTAMMTQRSSGGRLSQDGGQGQGQYYQQQQQQQQQMIEQHLLTGSLPNRGSSPFNTLSVPLGKLASSQDDDSEYAVECSSI
jgi:hypothetical protein